MINTSSTPRFSALNWEWHFSPPSRKAASIDNRMILLHTHERKETHRLLVYLWAINSWLPSKAEPMRKVTNVMDWTLKPCCKGDGQCSWFVRSWQWNNAGERKKIEAHTEPEIAWSEGCCSVCEHLCLWEQPRGKWTQMHMIQSWLNIQEGKIFPIIPIFSQGSWGTLGRAKSPQM